MLKYFQHCGAVLFVILFISSVSCSPRGNGSFISAPDDEPTAKTPVSDKDKALLNYYDSMKATAKNIPTRTVPSTTKQSLAKNESSDADLESLAIISSPRELFNGKDLTGWVNETGGDPQGWIVESGLLRLYDPANGKDLLTKDVFTNYILTFEWRFGKECNSGIKYKIEQPNQRGWVGLEYQIQDDANVEDGKIANRKIASLFDVLSAKESTKNSSFPVPKSKEPSGEFRQGKIVVLGNRVEHWIDGEKVLSFAIGNEEWNAAKTQSKFKNQKNFGTVVTSPILLQAHGYPIDFKSVTIQNLVPKE